MKEENIGNVIITNSSNLASNNDLFSPVKKKESIKKIILSVIPSVP